jgi:hypothetical protein
VNALFRNILMNEGTILKYILKGTRSEGVIWSHLAQDMGQ